MFRIVFILLLPLTLVSCIHFPFEPAQIQESELQKTETKPVWLVAGSLHTDFVVETKWLLDGGCNLPQKVQKFKYVCFGWGDYVAYTTRWGIEDVPQALFWRTSSIVQVVGFDTEVEPTFPTHDVRMSEVPAARGKALAHFINQSVSLQEGKPIELQQSNWGEGAFLQSPYKYYFPRMCNQWTATALGEAGMDNMNLSPTMTANTLKKKTAKFNSEP